jgi:hypothetical protein
MPTSASDLHGARAVDVKVSDHEPTVELEDGRTLAVPLVWRSTRTSASMASCRVTLEREPGFATAMASNPRIGRPTKRMQPTARRARRG